MRNFCKEQLGFLYEAPSVVKTIEERESRELAMRTLRAGYGAPKLSRENRKDIKDRVVRRFVVNLPGRIKPEDITVEVKRLRRHCSIYFACLLLENR